MNNVRFNIVGVDIIHNLESFPYPFEDSIFDEILCQDVLEHVEYIDVLRELHRILKPGGIIKIRVPHYSSFRNFVDPTHKKRFSIKTFDFFVKSPNNKRAYYFDYHYSDIISKRLLFQKSKITPINYIIEPLFNSFPKLLENLYEQSALCYLFPAENISIILQK